MEENPIGIMPSKKVAVLAAILLLVPQFVFAAGPRLVINQFALSAGTVDKGESLEFISVQLQNAGDVDCSDGNAQIVFVDADNVPVPEIPALTKQPFTVGVRKWKTVLFSASDPPPPNTALLPVGIFGALVTVSCNSLVQDEKIVFFSVREEQGFDIPEIPVLPFLLLVAGITVILFPKKR